MPVGCDDSGLLRKWISREIIAGEACGLLRNPIRHVERIRKCLIDFDKNTILQAVERISLNNDSWKWRREKI